MSWLLGDKQTHEFISLYMLPSIEKGLHERCNKNFVLLLQLFKESSTACVHNLCLAAFFFSSYSLLAMESGLPCVNVLKCFTMFIRNLGCFLFYITKKSIIRNKKFLNMY